MNVAVRDDLMRRISSVIVRSSPSMGVRELIVSILKEIKRNAQYHIDIVSNEIIDDNNKRNLISPDSSIKKKKNNVYRAIEKKWTSAFCSS